MNQDILNLIMIVAIIVLSLTGIATLIIVSKLYKMHDVRNEDGQYAWMVPSKLFELQSKINASQEMIAESLKSVSEHNAKIAKLMQTLVDSTLIMHQSIVSQNYSNTSILSND